MKYVKYDVYVDVDNIAEGLQRVIRKRPDLKDILSTGWENCTVNHEGSLLEGQTDQVHAVKQFGAKDKKLVMYDKLFCEGDMPGIVYDRYKGDYDMFNETLGFERHDRCLHLRNSSAFSTRKRPVYVQTLINLTTTDLATCRDCTNQEGRDK